MNETHKDRLIETLSEHMTREKAVELAPAMLARFEGFADRLANIISEEVRYHTDLVESFGLKGTPADNALSQVACGEMGFFLAYTATNLYLAGGFDGDEVMANIAEAMEQASRNHDAAGYEEDGGDKAAEEARATSG